MDLRCNLPLTIGGAEHVKISWHAHEVDAAVDGGLGSIDSPLGIQAALVVRGTLGDDGRHDCTPVAGLAAASHRAQLVARGVCFS